ncbi:MAG TPA: hypothetical protein VF913_21200 [Xanthobacteraceae bacterium]
MKELKQAFIEAFKEGLIVYFSPFTGLGRAIREAGHGGEPGSALRFSGRRLSARTGAEGGGTWPLLQSSAPHRARAS